MTKSENDLVRVGDKVLTRAELESFMPAGVYGSDSAQLADAFIQNWIDNQLLYSVAQKNIPDMESVNRKVQQYKQDLIIHQYRMLLINERLSEDLSEEDIQRYYETHSSEYLLEEPLYKGVFLKVRKNSPNIASLRKWVRQITPENLENIEKYAIKNSIGYRYSTDEWLADADISSYILDASKMQEGKSGEVSDQEYYYFYNLSDYRKKGMEMPLDYAQTLIRESLLKEKASEILNRQKQELYEKALSNKNVEYYYERK
ncbi:MAG: peptidyl-prolyl cis-trans isomerase [Bacteroidales bacterium]